MKRRIIGICILLVIVICGISGAILTLTHMGPGQFDYAYAVGNGTYTLHRTSTHSISITPNDGYENETEIIPEKVVEVAWNGQYVIAKQYGMKRKETDRAYEIPDETIINYWILDTENKLRYGPYKYGEFLIKLQNFNISNLELKPVEHYSEN